MMIGKLLQPKRFLLSACAFAAQFLTCGTSLDAAIIHISPTVPFLAAVDQITPFDLNDDGVVDYEFVGQTTLSLRPTAENRSVVTAIDIDDIQALDIGYLISGDVSPDVWTGRFTFPPPFENFVFGSSLLACGSLVGDPCRGFFAGETAYVGLEFAINGQIHYGWALIEGFRFVPGAFVYEWAYESLPNTPITTGAVPEPSSTILIAFALIGAFLAGRRRR